MTYEVTWIPSDTRWASRYVMTSASRFSVDGEVFECTRRLSPIFRWDTYLAMTDVQIHWFSIVNSVIVVFFLAGILSMIIVKTLRRDIARYNEENPVGFR